MPTIIEFLIRFFEMDQILLFLITSEYRNVDLKSTIFFSNIAILSKINKKKKVQIIDNVMYFV